MSNFESVVVIPVDDSIQAVFLLLSADVVG